MQEMEPREGLSCVSRVAQGENWAANESTHYVQGTQAVGVKLSE